MIVPIADPDDPRVAAYRDVKERDLVGRQGLFVAEGEVVLRTLAAARRFETLSVLVADKRLAKLQPILAGLSDDVPVYSASEAVVDAVAGFALHRGILAIGRRREAESAADLLGGLPAKARVLSLHGIGNHDNMGGLFRNAAAFGVDAALVDAGCCDPLYRKAIRVSVGAVLTTPFARLAPGEDALDLLAAGGFEALALTPSGAEGLEAVVPPDRAAVLVGAEGPGLDQALLARARTVRIGMAEGFDSLNVAVAAAIALHHLAVR